MAEQDFVIGVGFVERVTEKSIAAGWDRAFAVVRTSFPVQTNRCDTATARTAASWDAAFAKIAAQRAGRL